MLEDEALVLPTEDLGHFYREIQQRREALEETKSEVSYKLIKRI